MSDAASRDYLDARAAGILLVLTLLWGFNYSAIKYTSTAISPIFASALCSILASLCGVIYCLRTGQPLFHTDIMLFHGFMAGLLFGLEFVCKYLGMTYTDAARSVMFVYLSPFFVALGAHFLLKNDSLTLLKSLGLALAFMGVVIVFEGKPKSARPAMLFGDVLEIVAGFFWAATTLYIKRFLAYRVHPINTFLYQLVFSIPILLTASFLLEPQKIHRVDLSIAAAITYQSVIVAFWSYLAWFKLIRRYPVSRLSAFSFFTPIFGVLFGTFFLAEELTISLMMGLPLVCLGLFLVNWRRRQDARS